MLIDSLTKFNDIVPDLLACQKPVVDTETTGLNIWGVGGKEKSKIIGIAIATDYENYYFPFRHATGQNLPIELIQKFFKPYLSNHNRIFAGFNYKFDMHMLANDGIPYARNIEDVMLAVHLLNENEKNFKLKELCDRYGIGTGSLQESILEDKVYDKCKELGLPCSRSPKAEYNTKNMMYVLSPADVEPYACEDVILTKKLLNICIPALEHWGIYDLWKEVNYYSYINNHIESRGFEIDVELMNQYAKEADIHYKEAQEILNKLAGYNINANSSPQVCALLGVDSSSAEMLNLLIEAGGENAEIAKAVVLCRGWKSVVSRYYVPYSQALDKNNVLRTNLNLMGTISGRLSCSNPNLQAVARQTEVFKVKDIFKARKGFKLVSADYAQAEMRLGTWYAQEENMLKTINSGEDFHTSTANMLNIPRDVAKRINFGVIYGIGAEALSRQLRIPENTAREYLNTYHNTYKGFRRLMNTCERYADENGYIRMWTGRIRHYDINNPTHKAMSNLIQGGISEVMRVAISRLFPIVQDLDGYIVLQVHDQIIVEVPEENVGIMCEVMNNVMSDFPFNPKLIVDITYGDRWGKMEKYEV